MPNSAIAEVALGRTVVLTNLASFYPESGVECLRTAPRRLPLATEEQGECPDALPTRVRDAQASTPPPARPLVARVHAAQAAGWLSAWRLRMNVCRRSFFAPLGDLYFLPRLARSSTSGHDAAVRKTDCKASMCALIPIHVVSCASLLSMDRMSAVAKVLSHHEPAWM